jgi:polysaccharide export outer membrane protein
MTMNTKIRSVVACAAVAGVLGLGSVVKAQNGPPPPPPVKIAPDPAAPAKPPTPPSTQQAVIPPPDYIVGAEDILTVVFWGHKDLSSDVAVRPDGKISLPLLNDVHAAGLTPDQLRLVLTEAANKFVEDPTVTVIVKQIHSRRVYITGQVNKPGPYSLTSPMTVLQLIAMAGGVAEFADSENIMIMRVEQGKPMSYRFNYKDVLRRKNLKQNIELLPGDTIIVP